MEELFKTIAQPIALAAEAVAVLIIGFGVVEAVLGVAQIGQGVQAPSRGA
jgi:hypothetical protein